MIESLQRILRAEVREERLTSDPDPYVRGTLDAYQRVLDWITPTEEVA